MATHPTIQSPTTVTVMTGGQLKAGDTLPWLYAVLSDSVGPSDLTNAASVTLHMQQNSGMPLQTLSVSAAIQSPATSGAVTYQWRTTDTAIPGAYSAEFEVVYTDGSVARFPDTGFATINICPSIL